MVAAVSNTKKEIVTARCSTYVKEILDILSQIENISMSEIISKSVLEYQKHHFPDQLLFEKEKLLFGRHGSGKTDLSVKRKRYVKEIIGGKHRRR